MTDRDRMAISFGAFGRGPERDAEIPTVRVEAKHPANLGQFQGEGGVNVLVLEKEGDGVLLVLVPFDADADVARDLGVANRLDDPANSASGGRSCPPDIDWFLTPLIESTVRLNTRSAA